MLDTMKRIYSLILSVFFCLCCVSTSANDYLYTGEANNWGDTNMSVSTGGNYEYYGPISGADWLDIYLITTDPWTLYRETVISGFNQTDVPINPGVQASANISVDPAPASPYYIIVWKPNTTYNSNNFPVICASTTLPNDLTGPIFSAQATSASDVSVSGNTTDQLITAAEATILGGSMYISNGTNSSQKFIRPGWGYNDNGTPSFYFSDNLMPFKVSLNVALAAGDVITARFVKNDRDGEAGDGLWFFMPSELPKPASAPATAATLSSSVPVNQFADISYTVQSGDALEGKTVFCICPAVARSGFVNLLITRPSCSAPNHVDISGGYHFFPGETISLTAQAYSSAGTGSPITSGVTYQWQKFIGSAFQDIVGATDATYTKANATAEDAGQYRCIASTGDGCSTASASTKNNAFKLKCLQLYVYWDNNSDKCNLAFTKIDATHATASVFLENGTYTYHFKITDGQLNWWGNNGTMNSGNCTNWTLGDDIYCGLTTTKAATYTFNLTFNAGLTSFTMSVVYPSDNQTAGYNLYFANDVRQWTADNIHYRIGHSTRNNKYKMSKVNGTANLFQVTTSSFGGFEAWHIANNACWSDGNSIYKTKTGDAYAATEAVRFEGAPVPSTGWTVIPGNDYTIGGDAQNNNCKFYSFTTVPGMWTHNVSITPPAYGTLTVNYVDVNGVAQAFNSGSRDLAHTCIITVTAVPGMGYADPAVIYINGVAHGNRDPFVLTEDAVISVVFEPATYTITLNTNGGTINSGNVTSYTYGVGATLPTDVTKDGGYVFAGWFDNAGCTGSAVTSISTTDSGNKTFWAKWDEFSYVDIPGTVNKGNVAEYSADMTWYGANNDYFDFGPTDAPNMDRWAEWTVRIQYPDIFTIKEIYSCENGHYVTMDLMDGNTVLSTFTGENIGSAPDETERQYTTTWDLRGINAGIYTLRVRNTYGWSRPKVKSITFTGTIIPGTITITAIKVTDAPSYVGGAYGTITNTDISTHPAIPEGTTITDNGDNTLTINTATPITITAPLTTEGILTDIPEYYTPLSCVWRFDHWENVPTTGITSSVYIRAVYFPTFNVEYDTKGGTINEDPYPTWYRYTGDANDYQLLPIDVTKPGFAFAGWYQHATTELFTRLEGNYYGDYAGVWCLKAHWVLPCDEAQIISKVVLTGQNTYTVSGYNNDEYAGTPVVSVGSTTASYDFGTGIGTQTGYELSSTNDILFATLKKGDFRVGDTIIVAITAVNTIREASSTTNILALYYGNNASDAHLLVNMRNVSSPGIYKYPLSSDDVLAMNEVEAQGVGVFRESVNGENPCVYSIEIHGCRDLIFDDNHGTGVWNDPLNWGPTYTEIPSYYQATRIIRPCIVNIADAHALNAKLCKGNGNNGSLTINANAALEITQEVSEVHGTDYVTLYPVAAEDLIIKSSATNQGALAHGDTEGNTHATIEFYARGAGYPAANATWQYMGVPFSDVAHAIDHYYGSEMCRWYENETGNAGENWKWVNKPEALVPFVGYALTNPSAKVFTNQGTLVPSVNQTISLTCDGTNYKGWNLFANSWMAPINIARFEAADFGTGVQQTIYLFNTGTNDGHQSSFPNQNTETGSAGQYVAVPIATATVLGANKFIAPMQGFYLVTEAAANVTLNYDRLVRNSEHTALSVLPNRAPRYNSIQEEAEAMPRLIIDVLGTQFSDRLYIFENPNRTNEFDNAWDGYKFEGEAYAPQLMTRTNDLDLAVDVSPAFGGKQIAFRAGEDADYTLHFTTSEEGLVLRDLLIGTETPIEDGGTYHFFGTNKETNIRFEIVDNRREVPTSIEGPMDWDGQILSLRVYTADGRLVLYRTNGFDKPLLLPQSGVYILHMQTTTGLKTQKITF